MTNLRIYPQIRHRQRANRGQADRFFKDAGNWIKLANQRLSGPRKTKLEYSMHMGRVRKIKEGIVVIQGHMDYLASNRFWNKDIKIKLDRLNERLLEFNPPA